MLPANERSYDILVFGATGVTGKFVVEELALHVENVKWGVAGRNDKKLKAILNEVSEITGKNLDTVGVVLADVNSEALKTMCEQTKLVLNCVGPYCFYGEKVIEECIRSGTHHVDVSGEPQFLETIQIKLFNKAKESGVYIVGACGFDSIPCDLGVEYLKQNFKGDINSVESYLDLHSRKNGKANFGTWQSAINAIAHYSELKPLRKQLTKEVFTKKLPKSEYVLARRPLIFKSKDVKKWCLPFLGSDRSVVMRTQMYNYQFDNERPIQIRTYFCLPLLIHAFVYLFFGLVFGLLSKFAIGRWALEKFPEFFSLGIFSRTATRDQLISGSYTLTLIARGWMEALVEPSDQHSEYPVKKLKMVIHGPDSGYITTAISCVGAALIVLSEQDKLPKGGGVYTPGAAFKNTSLVQRLQNRGIKMTFID